MKRQIRRRMFDSNSSSTHTLTIMMKDEYDKWNAGTFIYTGWGRGYKNASIKPVNGKVYSQDEVLEFLKHSIFKLPDDFAEYDYEDMLIYFKEKDFVTTENYGDEYLESYEETYTTPGGETIVIFGEFGHKY